MKRLSSISVTIGLFGVVLVSAAAYFCNIDAFSHGMSTAEVRPAAVAEPICLPAAQAPAVTPAETASRAEVVPVKNEPTLAPMVFLPPQPRGQVVCVHVQVEQVVSSDGN